MYLELRPVSRPAKYGPEWDAYGLCDHRRWLSCPEGAGAEQSHPEPRRIARQFLRGDPFPARGAGDFQEDLISRDGRRFVVFLLPRDPFLPSHDPSRQQRTIFIPTLEGRSGP